jgi:hypothetical protein
VKAIIAKAQSTWLKKIQFQFVIVEELLRVRVCRQQYLKSPVKQKSIQLVGSHSPANVVTRFEDKWYHSSLDEPVRAC